MKLWFLNVYHMQTPISPEDLTIFRASEMKERNDDVERVRRYAIRHNCKNFKRIIDLK